MTERRLAPVQDDPDAVVWEVYDSAGVLRGYDRVPTAESPAGVESALHAAIAARIHLLQGLVDASSNDLDGVIAHAPVPAVPAGVFTGAQATVIGVLRDEVQTNRAGIRAVATYARDTRRGAQAVAQQLLDLLELLNRTT